MNSIPKHKIVLLGDGRAGKTSLVRRYMYDAFEDDVVATVGMDFQSKSVHLEDRTVRLQLWDTAGQERFRSLIPSYIRDAAGAVIVYDVTNRSSFSAVPEWLDAVRTERGNSAVVALVGNKIDISEERVVPTEEGKAQAEQFGLLFVETSAKAGSNVAELFRDVASAVPTGAAATPQADVLGAAADAAAAAGGAAAAAGAVGGPSPSLTLREQTPSEVSAKKKNCAC
eukprot:TRINITY_DN27567_c0_g1_i1.p1 TRINITY_DN27567_c0_g1~~TRINITY_DN27567_c0_g1_i1.p1  ORF type:complete len:227 (+),score=50.28 TRINITY_DN27567_c0_g1_i1:321-1001(+)